MGVTVLAEIFTSGAKWAKKYRHTLEAVAAEGDVGGGAVAVGVGVAARVDARRTAKIFNVKFVAFRVS